MSENGVKTLRSSVVVCVSAPNWGVETIHVDSEGYFLTRAGYQLRYLTLEKDARVSLLIVNGAGIKLAEIAAPVTISSAVHAGHLSDVFPLLYAWSGAYGLGNSTLSGTFDMRAEN